MSALADICAQYAKQLERIESLDVIQSRAAQLQSAGARRIELGQASDGTSIYAVGTGSGQRKLLLLSAPTGEGLLMAGVACTLMENLTGQGWQMWFIPALNPMMMKANESALSPGLNAGDLAVARRSQLVAADNPLANLPVDHGLLWQPDQLPEEGMPEGVAPCPPESLALARAINQLKPDLTVVLDESLAGPAELSFSAPLAEESIQGVEQALDGWQLALMDGRLPLGSWPGQTQETSERVGRLQSIEDLQGSREQVAAPKPVRQVMSSGKGRLMGGIHAWQFAEWVGCGPTMMVRFPRLTTPLLADNEHSGQQRQVTSELLEGKDGRTSVIWRLSGGKLDGLEVLRRPAQSDSPEGQLTVPLSKGMAAIEAAERRREMMRRAVEKLEGLKESNVGEGWKSALSLARHHRDALDGYMLAWRMTRRWHRPATRADVSWWQGPFVAQGAQLLGEVRHLLLREDRRDPDISDCLGWLENLIEYQLQHAEPMLERVGFDRIAGAAGALVEQALIAVDGGQVGAELRQEEVERITREIKQAEKHARDLKNLKAPRSQRAENQQLIADLKARLDEIHARETLDDQGPVAEEVEVEVSSSGPAESPSKPQQEDQQGVERPVADDGPVLRDRMIKRAALELPVSQPAMEAPGVPYKLRSRGIEQVPAGR